MKRIKAICSGKLREEDGRIECDEITLELDHGREFTIRRESVNGEDSITLMAGISREDKTANARFVVRPTSFCMIHLNIEQAK